ncbi:MAG: class glutamine amidotransferase [Hyphomicrobiales bacterium]|nr:class glutamine amidotransferase [Hyphomicrobiales bacterium]
MCRWIAYKGHPIFLETLVAAPERSLIAQSLHASEAPSPINGDGFGLGWYGERPEPGHYRELRPAWSDENLRSICAQVRSGLFFAHVRAATGAPSTRSNCHPFVHGRRMFMHNGQVGGFAHVKRRIEALIPDEHYGGRMGGTDSEAIFLAAFGAGLAHEPIAAMACTLKRVGAVMQDAGVAEPLRFTSALTDGETLWAFRWASDGQAPSLYYRTTGDALVVVSEPLDGEQGCWREVPQGCALVAAPGRALEVRCMNAAIRQAA